MSVSGTVCHLILYFSINQGLAINLRWPALKNKQCMCFELIKSFCHIMKKKCFNKIGQFFIFILLG